MIVMKVYCDIEFLVLFFETMPKYNPLEISNEFSYWDSYKKLFFDNCTLIFNDKQKYVELVGQNEIFLLLNKKKDGGNIDIKFSNRNDLLKDKNTLFFCVDDEECEDLEGEGKLAISNKTRNKWAKFLFTKQTLVIDGVNFNWKCLKEYYHPCEEIIVFDNYLLDNISDTVLEQEIKSLFGSLLPDLYENKHLSIKFVINAIGLREKKELVEDTIKELVNNAYSVTFDWINLATTLHDRHLLTN
jgi:hypothetical protein